MKYFIPVILKSFISLLTFWKALPIHVTSTSEQKALWNGEAALCLENSVDFFNTFFPCLPHQRDKWPFPVKGTNCDALLFPVLTERLQSSPGASPLAAPGLGMWGLIVPGLWVNQNITPWAEQGKVHPLTHQTQHRKQLLSLPLTSKFSTAKIKILGTGRSRSWAKPGLGRAGWETRWF